MGFIDYHGTKEDRYSEVLDYAHAQQEEDWKRKQFVKIRQWLIDLTGDGTLADKYIQELLKIVIIRYRELWSFWNELIGESSDVNGMTSDQLWEDFSKEYASRHIEPFHLLDEKRARHFDTFQIKIFKVSSDTEAESFYDSVAEKTKYRCYLTECFDPTWKGQQLFKYICFIAGKDRQKRELLDKFISTYKQLGLSTYLYLYQAIQPHDDGWMIQASAEWNALNEIEGGINRKTLPAPDYNILVNPLYVEKEEKRAAEVEKILQVPQSKLKKNLFEQYIEKGDIPSFINAIVLLMECELPDGIRENYDQLLERMPVLQDAIVKFDEVYHADMDQFNEYFAPEALKVTATYLDYQVAAPSDEILEVISGNVLLATRKLVQVVNEKIDEIYKYVMMDINAEAKALETVMIQDGHVDGRFKIN